MLTTKEVVARLRYQGEQYSNGQFSRGGGMQKHYLIQAADRIEQLEAQLAKARSDALEEAAEICQSVAIEFGGYDPEGPSSLEAAHKLEGALACRSEILAKEKK